MLADSEHRVRQCEAKDHESEHVEAINGVHSPKDYTRRVSHGNISHLSVTFAVRWWYPRGVPGLPSGLPQFPPPPVVDDPADNEWPRATLALITLVHELTERNRILSEQLIVEIRRTGGS